MASPYKWPAGLQDDECPPLPPLPGHLVPLIVDLGRPSWISHAMCRLIGHMACGCPECQEAGWLICDRCGFEDAQAQEGLAEARSMEAESLVAYIDWKAQRAAFARANRHA